ncbi:metal-sensing transcriptional repressor [Clostridium sp.]|jgi:CsoR family transcriptional regulator, copper-sensing transcriptional repressor|uniref:metal-sensing transcriptional repressor n=1 Tax=Clostridium sp. TaxID=1506 RepID=UPI0039F5D07E
MNQEKMNAVKLLKTSKGQIEGIIRMVEDERYCVDVSNQIIAAQALLKKANILILKQHIHHCVKDALGKDSSEEKLEEIINILEKVIQK